jgi:hypothetical protein
MFRAVRQVTIYIRSTNNFTVIRYNDIQICGKPPTCFGHFQGSIISHYYISLRWIPPWRWPTKAETCRRFTICLCIIVSNYSADVNIYMICCCFFFLFWCTFFCFFLYSVQWQDMEGRGSISSKLERSGLFLRYSCQNLVSGPPTLLSNGYQRLFHLQEGCRSV